METGHDPRAGQGLGWRHNAPSALEPLAAIVEIALLLFPSRSTVECAPRADRHFDLLAKENRRSIVETAVPVPRPRTTLSGQIDFNQRQSQTLRRTMIEL